MSEKAPAGGMVANNLAYPGGQFIPRAFKRVSHVMALMRKGAVKLARKPEFIPTGEKVKPLGEAETPRAAHQVYGDEPFTLSQLRAIEEQHGVPERHRLSPKVSVDAKGHVQATLAQLHRFLHTSFASLPRHDLKTRLRDPDVADEDKFATVVHHLAREAGHAQDMRPESGADVWYGEHVDALEKALQKVHGFSRKSPRQSLFKALVALTSGGQNPKVNTLIAHRMYKAGLAANPKHPFEGIPARQHDRLAAWLRKAEEANGGKPLPPPPDPKTDPHGAASWYALHVLPHPQLWKDKGAVGYSGAPARLVNAPGTKLHGLVTDVMDGDEWRSVKSPLRDLVWRLPEKERRKILQLHTLPLPDANGGVKAKGWSSRGEIVEDKLRELQKVLAHFDGDEEKAADWLRTSHTEQQFRDVVGHEPDRGYIDDPLLPGSFIFGPKFGPFFLNLHSNDRKQAAYYGKYLTPDMWWARTWNRLLGTLLVGKGHQGPRNDRERRVMWAAARHAARVAGLRSVAELQAVLWYNEQRFHRLFGVKSASYSYLDGAKAILQEAANAKRAKETG